MLLFPASVVGVTGSKFFCTFRPTYNFEFKMQSRHSVTINLKHEFYISQGSVATHLRCGGIFNDSIITNFLLILKVK